MINKNKKIGIVSTWFPSGAGYVSRQYKEILEKDHEIFIYARGGAILKGNSLWDSAQVTWAPNHSEITGIYWKHFKRWVQDNGIELVFFNEQRYWPIVLKAKDYGLQIGAYIDYYTQDTVPFFELFDFLICNTKRHYSVFDWHRNCHYIPWGVSNNRWPKAAHNDKRTVTFIISSGWDGAYAKNHKWMDRRGTGSTIDAFRSVKGKCNLEVYSQVALEDCPAEWQTQVNSDDRIKFIHGTFEPFPFENGSVYVYPSRLDGIGLTVPEAICAGLPVIATDTAPMNEFVSDGVNGLLIKVKRLISRPDGYYWPESLICESSLSEAMQNYVDNRSLIQQHGKNSIEYAAKFLHWETNAAHIPKIFSDQFELNNPSPILRTAVNDFSLKQKKTITYLMIRAIKSKFKHSTKLIYMQSVFKKIFKIVFNY